MSAKNETQKDDNQKVETVPFLSLFRYATFADKLLITLGTIGAMGNGLAFPYFGILFADVVNIFGPQNTPQQVVDEALTICYYFLLLSLFSFVCSFCMFACYMISGERQTIEYRKRYYQSIMRQEVGWHDTINPNTFATKVQTECTQIQDAISQKVSTLIMTASMIVGGFVLGYLKGWKLALILTGALPFLALGVAIFTHFLQKINSTTQKIYAEAGGKAEESIMQIKTVKSLTAEDFNVKLYNESLQLTKDLTLKLAISVGFGLGLMMFSMFADHAFAFYIGGIFISENYYNDITGKNYNMADVFGVFVTVMMGAQGLGQAAPSLKAMSIGQEAGFRMFRVIDRPTQIIINDQSKKQVTKLEGKIEFEDVLFSFPSNPEKMILKGINIQIKPGQKIGLVGESGCGKSTIMQLIERFYDRSSGHIKIDDVDIKEYNLKSLRQKIGYVSQEPVLFDTSIRENLLYGRRDATEQEMIDALKQANIWKFVSNLPKGIDSQVGYQGGKLSGGQKQRIAIARAILKNPQILLLDEATSALDRVNEKQIQKTLDKISQNRTTICIAHKMKTIQNSDVIYFIQDGIVSEYGNHQELMQLKKKYFALVNNQVNENDDNTDNQNDNVDDDQQQDSLILETRKNSTNNNEEIKNCKASDEESCNFKIFEMDENKIKKKEIANENDNDELLAKDEKKLTKEEKQLVQKKQEQLKQRLSQYDVSQRLYFYLGILCSSINGTFFPLFGIFMGIVMAVMVDPSRPDFTEVININSLILFFISLGLLFTSLGSLYCWTRVGHSLTTKLRNDVYRKMMHMPISFFENQNNSPGALSSKLATDAQAVNGLVTTVVDIMITNLMAFAFGMCVAFYYSWRMTLVTLALCPIILIAAVIQMQFINGFSENNDNAYKASGGLIMETVTNIRTVLSFADEEKIMELYGTMLKEPMMNSSKKGMIAGASFGFSNMGIFIVYGVLFYIGAIFCRDTGLTLENMLQALFGIIFASFAGGNAGFFMPDINSAFRGASGLFNILDSKDEQQLQGENIKEIDINKIQGNIEFRNVKFGYPSRSKYLFEDFNLQIKSGQKIALCGPSGCGKSTILHLLLRYYEIESGQIYLDGIDIQKIDVQQLRRIFGVVSQEPLLFNGDIKFNIQYNTQNVSKEDIQESAKQANAHDFIVKNEFNIVQEFQIENQNNMINNSEQGNGYDRKVGSKGNQISGGQKQRIAIARAILKQPKILLLDEATSALDSVSEKIVQESLENIMKGKTSISIAHRLSTVQNSDVIYMFQEGKICEQGTYNELMQKKGQFYNFERGQK